MRFPISLLFAAVISVCAYAQSPYLVSDINTTSAVTSSPSSNPAKLIASGSLVYFTADGPGAGDKLWRSDGTAAGTILLAQPGTSIGPSAAWRGELWFSAGTALWRTDGTTAGTRSFADPFRVTEIFGGSNHLYLSASPSVSDYGMWRSDGTTAGTIRLVPADRALDVPSNPREFVEQTGRVYARAGSIFGAYAGLFVTAGTPQTTRRIVDFPLHGHNGPRTLTSAAGLLLGVGATSESGSEVWRSDGTVEGTRLLKEIAAGGLSSTPSDLTAAGPYLFFVAFDHVHGSELWRSDGTAAGTILVKDIARGAASSTPRHLVAVGSVVYFAADDGTSGVELWRSDGTPEGTSRVVDLRPGAASSSPAALAAADGSLFFAADDGIHGVELWRTTGIDSVTMVADLAPGSASSSPAELTVAGSRLFFAATTSVGRELWALPLTAASFSVADVRVTEGNAGSAVARFAVTRSGSAADTASVTFATRDGSAAAGSDYAASSGTLSFAAGETAKMIEVLVHGDELLEENEAFFVMLGGATGAVVVRGTATAFVDEDDRRADLGLEWVPLTGAELHNRRLRLSNHGPSVATGVTLRYSETPGRFSVSGSSVVCSGESFHLCSFPPIAPGASVELSVYGDLDGYFDPSSPPGRTVHASVSGAEPDPTPANNSLANLFSDDGQLMLPPFLQTRSTAAATIDVVKPRQSDLTVSFQSAATDRLTASPQSLVIPAAGRSASFTLATGALPGSVRFTANKPPYPSSSLMVPVVEPGTEPRLDVLLTQPSVSVASGQPADLRVEVLARRHDGTLPTGNVALFVAATGEVLAQQPLAGGATTFRRTGLPPGVHRWTVRYDGDAIFNPLSGAIAEVRVSAWHTTARIRLQSLVCDAAEVRVTVSTSSGPRPAGSVELRSGGALLATVPLQPATDPSQASATYRHTFPLGTSSVSATFVPADAQLFHSSSATDSVERVTCVPMGVSATGRSTPNREVVVTWTHTGAHHYDVMQLQSQGDWARVGSATGSSFTTQFVLPDAVSLFAVRAMNADNTVHQYSLPDLATTVFFTDDPAAPRTLPIRAAHIAQLQTAARSLATLAGEPAPALSPTAVRAPLRAAHLNELRAAIASARQALGLPPVSFTDTLAPGVAVKAIHLQELRNAVK